MHGLCALYTALSTSANCSVIAGEFEHRTSLTSDQNSLVSSRRPSLPSAIIIYNMFRHCVPSRNKILAVPLPVGFPLSRQQGIWGATEVKCTHVYDALPCALGILLKFKSFTETHI